MGMKHKHRWTSNSHTEGCTHCGLKQGVYNRLSKAKWVETWRPGQRNRWVHKNLGWDVSLSQALDLMKTNEKAYGASLTCCNGTEGCSGKGEKHSCEESFEEGVKTLKEPFKPHVRLIKKVLAQLDKPTEVSPPPKCPDCGTDTSDPRYGNGTWVHHSVECINALKVRVANAEDLLKSREVILQTLKALKSNEKMTIAEWVDTFNAIDTALVWK
jgi:hypothetical protein